MPKPTYEIKLATPFNSTVHSYQLGGAWPTPNGNFYSKMGYYSTLDRGKSIIFLKDENTDESQLIDFFDWSPETENHTLIYKIHSARRTDKTKKSEKPWWQYHGNFVQPTGTNLLIGQIWTLPHPTEECPVYLIKPNSAAAQKIAEAPENPQGPFKEAEQPASEEDLI